MKFLLTKNHLAYALVALCFAGCTTPPSHSRSDAPTATDIAYTRPPANEEAQRRLYGPVDLQTGIFTLTQIAQLIHSQTGVPVRLDWDGLSEIEVTCETTVELIEGESSAEKLLAMTLYEAAPKARDIFPTYLFIDGTIVIGTNRSLRRLAPQVGWPHGEPRVVDIDTIVINTLEDTIVICNFRNIPLRHMIDDLRRTTGLDFVVNWGALEFVGVKPDQLITFYLSHATAADVLRLSLEQASAENFEDDKAGYMVVDGIVHVSPLRELKTNTDVHVYDIRDLIGRPYGPLLETLYADDEIAWELLTRHRLAWAIEIEGWRGRPVFDLNDALSNNDSGGSPLEAALEQQTEDIKPFSEREMMIEHLYLLIQDTVGDPDEWLDEESTIRELNGNFIIKTTPSNHRDIERLLSRLRETRGYDRFMREVEVTRHLRDAEALRQQGELEKALERVNLALDVDPANEVARALKRVITDTIARRQTRE